MTYGSLFAGVGGFDTGFDAAGMDCRWQVEWNKACQKLLAAKWPKAKHYGDITKTRAADLERVDIVCGGSPCQNLSVAGKRAGLAGEQSGLFFDMVRICKHQRRRGGARHVVWENVDGAFSSNNGRDFAAVLRAFTGVAVEVPADGWGRAGFIKTPFPAWRWNCAWRLFDAQYFGVAQRRRRVFLVASAGDGSCAEILFEPESLRGDSPPSRGAGEGVARGIGEGASSSGEPIAEISVALSARASMDRPESGAVTLIVDSLRAKRPGEGGISGDDTHLVVAPEISPALNVQSGQHHAPDTKAYVIAFSYKDYGGDATEGLSPTLRARQESYGGGPPAIAFNHQAGGSQCPISPSVERANCLQVGQGQSVAHAQSTKRDLAVRRLTPTECERLMSWPDGHTAGFADSTRYKMCGNGVVSACAEWIGRRIFQLVTNAALANSPKTCMLSFVAGAHFRAKAIPY